MSSWLFFSPVVLSVVPGLAASTQPGNLLEMQILKYFPDLMNLKIDSR